MVCYWARLFRGDWRIGWKKNQPCTTPGAGFERCSEWLNCGMEWGCASSRQGLYSTHGRQGNADIEDYSGKAASKSQNQAGEIKCLIEYETREG